MKFFSLILLPFYLATFIIGYLLRPIFHGFCDGFFGYKQVGSFFRKFK